MTTRKKTDFLFEEKMDMTPLIDCVFLLILFFILTTEITMTQEDVNLPFALEGKTSDELAALDTTVTISVVRNHDSEERGAGEIKYKGEVVDFNGLIEVLRKEVQYDAYGRGRAPEAVANSNKKLSQVKVLIRADKDVNAEFLRTIFHACEKVDPAIYKIEISSEEPRAP